jgi:uncharacterized protein YciI
MILLTAALLMVTPVPPQAAPADLPQASAQTRTLFIVSYRPGPKWIAGKPNHEQALGPHAAYIKRLLDEGVLFAGGPYGDNEGGMAIFWATDMDQAKAIVAADPAVTQGVFVPELRGWTPRFDSKRLLAS